MFIIFAQDIKGRCWWHDTCQQYFIKLCCHVTNSSKETMRQNSICLGSTYETKVCHWIPPWGERKKTTTKKTPLDIHQCLLNTDEGQPMDASTVKWWVVHFSSGNNNVKDKSYSRQSCRCLEVQHAGSSSSLAKIHSQRWCLCWKIVFCSSEFAL